jgi:hypothetical protein
MDTNSHIRNDKLRLARRKKMWTMKETADKLGLQFEWPIFYTSNSMLYSIIPSYG